MIDTPADLSASKMAMVSGGKPLVITVVISVEFFADEVIGAIDFATFNQATNVTGVIVNLE